MVFRTGYWINLCDQAPGAATKHRMKTATLILALACTGFVSAGQTATNFTCNDCAGTSHTLFNELDAGKVIVLCWVMPCSACTGPSLTTYNVVQSFQAAHPGKVVMYVVDDYANTSCVSLTSWANSIGLANTTKFSNPAIQMTDYGSDGMPKIVVLGGSAHTVFYNVNNTVSGSALQAAINAAISVTGIAETNGQDVALTITPNPVSQTAMVRYSIKESSSVSIELFNLSGDRVYSSLPGTLAAGDHEVLLDVSGLAAGEYVLRLTADGHSNIGNLIVSR